MGTVFILGLLGGGGGGDFPPKISGSPPKIVSDYYTILIGLSLFLKQHTKQALRFILRVVNMKIFPRLNIANATLKCYQIQYQIN